MSPRAIQPPDLYERHQDERREIRLLRREVDRLRAENEELNSAIGAMQDALKILKGDKIVHSTIEKELVKAAMAMRRDLNDARENYRMLARHHNQHCTCLTIF